MRSGANHVGEIRYPKGHEKNPMTDSEIERKFFELSAGRLSAKQGAKVIETLWHLERVEDVRTVIALLSPKE